MSLKSSAYGGGGSKFGSGGHSAGRLGSGQLLRDSAAQNILSKNGGTTGFNQSKNTTQ